MVSDLWVNLFNKKGESDHLTILSNNMLFQTLDKRELRFVNKTIHERTYHKGEVIFQQGSLGTGMYIIIKGSVDMFIKDKESKNQVEDKSVHVAHLTKKTFLVNSVW